jgi:hypothetical protein
MSFRFAWIVLIMAVLSVPHLGQSPSRVVIDSDIRLFTTMAAVNIAGYDVELASQYHPVREAARRLADRLDPGLIQRLRAFYALHKGSESDDAQLPKYISLAVHLTNPPEFKLTVREEILPPDARSVADFVPLLQEVYERAQVADLRNRFRAEYEREINSHGPELRDMIFLADAYLRVPLGRPTFQTMAIYVELAAPVNSVNVRSYQDDYYVVLGSTTSPRIDDVRHAYLHFQLDSVVARNLQRIQNGSVLLSMVSGVQGVQREYVSDFYVMATESLIRAVELRIARTPSASARETVDGFYRSGLLLVPYFYDALSLYEEREEGIREYFAEMASAIRIADEQIRFQERFSKIPVPERVVARPEVPQPIPAAAPDPVRDLLKAGETAFNAGDNDAAKTSFEKVLSDFDANNGAAAYGLALIASRQGDSETAKDYFDRTVRSGSAEPGMKVWAYIYLARIFDIDCRREQALEYYRQAINIGDNTRNARTVAEQGLATPFGDGCR